MIVHPHNQLDYRQRCMGNIAYSEEIPYAIMGSNNILQPSTLAC